jgi:hypothetical protein
MVGIFLHGGFFDWNCKIEIFLRKHYYMALKALRFTSNRLQHKQSLIERLSKGKSVVHYGCVDDNLPIIEHKIREGYYLHKVISDNATRCIGIDINRTLIQALHEQHQISNIFYGNVEDPNTFEMNIGELKSFQVLMIPDIIEHLDNVGNMLTGIRAHFSPQTELYIMSPNPTCYLQFGATLFRRELYSPYHTCIFNTESMRLLLSHHGFTIDNIWPVFVPKEQSWIWKGTDRILSRGFNLLSPGFADAYMYGCSFQ